MHPSVAPHFNKLREIVREGSGRDFLAKCGDILRDYHFTSHKDGVADHSWHKTGRAFDYDQTSPYLVLVSEPKQGKQYFRTYLVCKDQSGKQGVKKSLRDIRGSSSSAYVFDFTAAAESVGFRRIPAWTGWQTHYNRREFWHYEMREGLTWEQAMSKI
jgi:TolB protein